MKRVLKIFSASLVIVSMAASCDYIKDVIDSYEEEITDENDGESSEEDDEIKVNDYLIEIGAEGVSDVNMLDFCINMTHLYKYTVTGLEDCTWARVRHASCHAT